MKNLTKQKIMIKTVHVWVSVEKTEAEKINNKRQKIQTTIR